MALLREEWQVAEGRRLSGRAELPLELP
jgi:hypothetical protein